MSVVCLGEFPGVGEYIMEKCPGGIVWSGSPDTGLYRIKVSFDRLYTIISASRVKNCDV